MKNLLKQSAGRLLGAFMLVMMIGSGSLGLCWCNLLETHDCHDHAAGYMQLSAEAEGGCNCEFCNCCSQGVPAMVEMIVTQHVPMQPVALALASDESCLHDLAADIFIPPKITA